MVEYGLNLEILWWSAILAGHKDTIKEMIQFGINPFVSLNGQIGSEAVIQFTIRLKRMIDITKDMNLVANPVRSVHESEKRLKNYMSIISIIHNAEHRHISKLIMKRFLRRYVRFMRREIILRQIVFTKKVFMQYTSINILNSPVKLVLEYIVGEDYLSLYKLSAILGNV